MRSNPAPFRLPSILTFILAGLFFAGPAIAATEAPYSQAAFAAAQLQGKPIVLHVIASWCPTCAKQRPIVTKLSAEPAFKDLLIFDVDFDTQKPLLRRLGVQQQSTFIVYRGSTEEARSTGQTDEAAIRELLAQSKG